MGKAKLEKSVRKSVVKALFEDSEEKKRSSCGPFLAFFSMYHLPLVRFRRALFYRLRNEVWEIDEDEYRESFRGSTGKAALKPIGDLGYSGSTFFTTQNSEYLVKSLPRYFEYSFFRDEMLQPYYDHMRQHPSSLLVRITDFLQCKYKTLGGLLRLVPTHHIIMENVLYGKESDSSPDRWETYDLKPISYFFPERDVMYGNLTSKATKERLADKFQDKLRITKEQCEELLALLAADTEVLVNTKVVDYSLYLVRIPASSEPKSVACRSSAWRIGITSTDNKWIYRIVLLDFLWSKHKLHAQAITGVVQTWNVVGRYGPMSITTTPEEYRDRFLAMVSDIVEVSRQE